MFCIFKGNKYIEYLLAVVQWLAEAGVVASDEVRYTTGQVWDAVVTATGGFRPHIDCIRVEGEAYITEVKVCYTKNLTRVDCDGIKAVKGQTGDMMGTCLRYTSLNLVHGNLLAV